MVTPILEALRSFSDDFIFDAIVMNPVSASILNNEPLLKNVFLIDFLNISLFSAMNKIINIRRNKYDKSFLIFPANLYKYQIIHRLFGAKERYSHLYQKKSVLDLFWLSNRKIAENRKLHSVEENFNLFEFGLNVKLDRNYQMKINLNLTEKDFANSYIQKLSLTGKKIIGIHAGSDILKNMINRRWSVTKFGKLLKRISTDNDNYYFLIFGGKDELKINKKISSFLPKMSTVVKDTNFLQSTSIIAHCNYFISNDSGLMHTATALNIPILLILGPTNPTYIKPYRSIHEIASKEYDCMPCFEYSKTPLICTQQQQFRCMKELSVEDVYLKFKLLERRVINKEHPLIP